MSELKPCPFCGGCKIVNEEELNVTLCYGCSAETDISDWNTRPIEDALTARIAELEEAYLQTEDERDNIIIERWVEEGKLLKRIAELEAAQRWIPVSERLPENGNHVLAFVNLEPFIAFHMSEFPRWISVLDHHFFDNENYEDITHWMPLPESPNDVRFVGRS